jgi:signal transduction histidine kinase
VLTRNLELLDQAGRKEARAKEVISQCQEIRTIGAQTMMRLTGRQLLQSTGDVDFSKDYLKRINDPFDTLEQLVQGDAVAMKLVQEYKGHCITLSNIMGDAGKILDDPEVPQWAERKRLIHARYLNEIEQMEEGVYVFTKCVRVEAEIVSRFKPVLKEWRPRALRERQNLRTNILAAVLIETLIALGIAMVVGKNILDRLSILMKNIESFSKNKPVEAMIEGDDELAELNSKFQEMASARYEAEEFKSNLMSMVAHDIRSPLSSANLTIDIMLQRGGDQLDDWMKKRLTRLDGEMRRLIRLTNSLLDIEKIETNKLTLNLESARVEALLEATVSSLEGSAAAKKVKLEQIVAVDTDIVCDKERVIQILINLVSNALKFAPAGSNVTLNVFVLKEGDRVRFEVLDRGAGVPVNERDRLFHKFSQLSQQADIKKQGSGFGLYLTNMIVLAHNGSVGYEERSEGGSCFFFELPVQCRLEEA